MDIITLGLLVKIAFALSVADDLTDVKKKLWETTGEVAGAWLDKVLNRLPPSVRDATKTAERQIKAHQTMLRLDETRQAVAFTIAGHLLRAHAPSAADIVHAAYDADTLTTQILRNGQTILAEIDGMEGENEAVQAVLTILLRHVLTQADSLQATESLWRRVMQDGQADILAELRRLPDDLFLRSLAGLSLLRPNAPLPFRKDMLSASELLTARHTDLSLRGRDGEMETLLALGHNRQPVRPAPADRPRRPWQDPSCPGTLPPAGTAGLAHRLPAGPATRPVQYPSCRPVRRRPPHPDHHRLCRRSDGGCAPFHRAC